MNNMTKENEKWFYEILEKCESLFGDRMVDGRITNIIRAFENDTIDEFVGSKERDLNLMSILCTIKELLSKDKPEKEQASLMFKNICKTMHLSL